MAIHSRNCIAIHAFINAFQRDHFELEALQNAFQWKYKNCNYLAQFKKVISFVLLYLYCSSRPAVVNQAV